MSNEWERLKARARALCTTQAAKRWCEAAISYGELLRNIAKLVGEDGTKPTNEPVRVAPSNRGRAVRKPRPEWN